MKSAPKISKHLVVLAMCFFLFTATAAFAGIALSAEGTGIKILKSAEPK